MYMCMKVNDLIAYIYIYTYSEAGELFVGRLGAVVPGFRLE